MPPPKFGNDLGKSEENLHRNGGSRSDSRVDLKGIGILFHIGKSHAGTEAESTDLILRRGISLLHGKCHIGDPGTFVPQDDRDLVLTDRDVGIAAVRVNDHVDLTLVHGDCHLAYDLGGITELTELLLNQKRAVVNDYRELPDGRTERVFNAKETILARECQDKIEQAFHDWVMADKDRIQIIEDRFNALFNNIKPRTYNGDYITIPGMNPNLTLRPHQKNVIARIAATGTCMMAHEVGAGKTAAMGAAGMYLKSIGACTKPMYVEGLIRELRRSANLPIAVYPNSGEEYDPTTKTWHGAQDGKSFHDWALAYYRTGADAVGGCCTTTETHIRQVAEAREDFRRAGCARTILK